MSDEPRKIAKYVAQTEDSKSGQKFLGFELFPPITDDMGCAHDVALMDCYGNITLGDSIVLGFKKIGYEVEK